MFNVHEEFPDHPKVEHLESLCRDESELFAALGLWLAMGCDCRLRLTDGHFTEARLRKLAGKAIKYADRLVTVRLWHRTEDGYVFHDWAHVQETKAEVQGRRQKDRDRKRNRKRQDSVEASARLPDGSRGDSKHDSGPPRGGMGGVGEDPDQVWALIADHHAQKSGALTASSRMQRDAHEVARVYGAGWLDAYERWCADPWVRETCPPLSHLADNPSKYSADAAPAEVPDTYAHLPRYQ